MQQSTATNLTTGKLVRSFALNRATLNKEKRTVTVVASTETPVERWFGTEILSHASGAVRLDRLKNGAAVFLEHDSSRHCGVTESASINGNQLEVELRFARDADGDFAMNRVEDGIYRFVSVGYHVNRFEVNDKEEEYRAIDWEPLEVSLVGIPADPKAKVLRSNSAAAEHESIVMKRTLLLEAQASGTTGGSVAAAVITKEDFSRELDEAREIVGIQSHYQRTHPEIVGLCEKALKDKMPIREFLRKSLEITSKPAEQTATITATATTGARKDNSIGARFVNSESYKRAIKNGKIGSGNHIQVDLPDISNFSRATTFGIGTSDISGATDIGGTSGANIDIMKEWNRLNQQPITIAQLIGQGSTTGDNVRFIRELTFTNDATRVAEAGAKPQASLDFGVFNATVEKTSVFLKVTEEMLADWAQAQSIINESLGYMVADKEDSFLLNGTGSSQITGLYNTSGLQTISGAANTIDVFKKAKAYIEGAAGTGFATCDAYVMNPLDWLSISLTKDGNGQYLFGGPGYAPYGVGGYSNVSMMWGVPVVTTVRNTQGQAIGGSFRNGATQWRRAGVSIRTTDSDGTDFQNGIVTVCADARMTLTVKQPGRFCTVTSIPAAV